MKSEIPMNFEVQKLEGLPVQLLPAASPAKPKPDQKKAMAEIQAFAKFGVQVLRVKTAVLTALGSEAESGGVRKLGHGKIILASEKAETFIDRLDALAKKLTEEEKPDYHLVLDVMTLAKECNSQLIRTAEAHLSADKPLSPSSPPNGITIPYPAGSAVMIGVGKAPAVPQSET